jgi:hypothetical protein
MSGFISSLPSLSDAISAISSFAFGSTGGVVLGDFAFGGFEVPETISIPGNQAMTVHKLPGGERVIDVLGDDPGEISWSGIIIDGDPASRAQQLETMRAAGAPLPLQWGTFFYTVVIRSFQAKVMYSRVGYDISCTVLQNEATAQQASDPSLTDAVGGDIGSALASAPAALSSALATAQTGVAALGRLIPGSPLLAQASATLGAANGSLQSLATSSGNLIGAVTSGAALSSIASNAGTMAQSLQSAAFVGRSLRNLL